MTDKSLKEWAITYAQCGLAVLPVAEQGKTPILKDWTHKATTDLQQIEKWWTENPNYNIGIATGSISKGLTVIDIDQNNGKNGIESFKEWMNENGKPIGTATAHSGNGGIHLYYWSNISYKNATNLLKNVDVRAEGGCIIAPPSVLEDGKCYSWDKRLSFNDGKGIQKADKLIHKLLNSKRVKNNDSIQSQYLQERPIEQGTRINTLVSMIGTFKRNDKDNTPNESIKEMIRNINNSICNPPLSEKELETQVFPCLTRGWGPIKKYYAEEPIQAEQLPPVKEIDFNNMEELPPVAIDNILRQGQKMILMGPSKASKTFTLIELAFAFAEGMNWLGFRCKQQRVLYCNLEVAESSFNNRIYKIYEAHGMLRGNHAKENIISWTLRGHSRPIRQLKQAIIDQAKKYDCKVIIIDPLYKVMDGDENSNSDVGRMCCEFDSIAQETEACIIYAHHYAKGNSSEKSQIDRGAGAGAFARDPDTILTMTQLDWFSENTLKPNVTAWRIESNLREFPNIEPIDVFFDYPIHKLDSEGILKDCNFLATVPNRKTRLELNNEKIIVDEIMTNLKQTTISEFMESYLRRTNKSISDKTAKNMLIRNGYSKLDFKHGRAELYGKQEEK